MYRKVKPMPTELAERNSMIKATYQSNKPTPTYTQLGKIFGISRQRVWQIIKGKEVSTKE